MKQILLPAAGLLMALLLGSCTRETGEIQSMPEVVSFSSTPDGKTEIAYTQDGQQHKQAYQGAKITALFIGGKKMPEGTYARQEATGKQILQQIRADGAKIESALTPPMAKAQTIGQDRIEVMNLISNDTKHAPAAEKRDEVQTKEERKAANKRGNQ